MTRDRGPWVIGLLVVLASVIYVRLAGAPGPYWVDGACAGNTGNGANISPCGATGPFATIGEAIDVMVAGDTVNVRGAHDAFDGYYHEEVWLDAAASRPAGIAHGRILNCQAAACTIQGYNGERPFIQAAKLHADWTCVTNCGAGDPTAIWRRQMEVAIDTSPDGTNLGRATSSCIGGANNGLSCAVAGDCPSGTCTADSVLDTFILYTNHPPAGAEAPEGNVELPYQVNPGGGDNEPSPADGYWSYHFGGDPANFGGYIYVNPPGADDPNLTILVPFSWSAMQIDGGTQNLYLQDLDLGYSRGNGISENPGGATVNKPNMHLIRVHMKHYRGKGILTHLWTNAVLTDNIFEYCGRGISNSASSNDGCWGLRIFNSPGFTMNGHNIFRYLGCAGEVRVSIVGTCTGGTRDTLVCHNNFDCPGGTCSVGGTAPTHTFSEGDAPWNSTAHTYQGITGLAQQYKQTFGDGSTIGSGITITGNEEIYQAQEGCLSFDTVTEGLAEGVYCHDSGSSFAITNTTPVPLSNCRPGVGGNACFASNNVIRNSRWINMAGGATSSSLGSNNAAATLCGTDNVAVCHGGSRVGLTCTTDDCNAVTGCPGAGTCPGTPCTGTGTCCFVERETEIAGGVEANNPVWQIYGNQFGGVGWSAILVVGGTVAGGACQHQQTNPGNGIIENNSISGVSATSDAGCTTNGCRGIVVRDVSANQGITIRNNLIDGMTDESLVISSSALTNLAATSSPIDFTLYGTQNGPCPSGCTCTGDTTNVVVRYGATIPASGSSGVPGGGTCNTVATWKANNSPNDASAVRGNPQFTESGVTLSINAGSAAIDVGQTETAFTTDFYGHLRGQGAGWDIGCCEFVPGAPGSPASPMRPGKMAPIPLTPKSHSPGRMAPHHIFFWWPGFYRLPEAA